MLIPKGTVIVGNTWAVLHDPASYDEPEKFNPDRFIKNKYGIRNDLAGEEDWRNTFPYGAGRRICELSGS
jgi:cytochrome P450